MKKWQRKTQSSTYAKGLFTPSYLSCIVSPPPPSSLCCPKPSSRHPYNLTSVYPVPALPLTSAINTLLAIRYSSILSTCPNHLKTHWSALLANSLSIPALLRTSSFPTQSIRDTPTKLLKHFILKTFTFLLPALLIPQVSAPYNAVGTITPSYRHFFKFIHNPYCSAHFLGLPTLYTPLFF